MTWTNSNSYPFNEMSVFLNAPPESGVYALYTSQQWVYIGESQDIRGRLTQQAKGDNLCVVQQSPTHFSFELWPESLRVAIQNELILELNPACNQRLG